MTNLLALLGLLSDDMPPDAKIAIVAHEVNRLYCKTQHMAVPPAWMDLSDNLKNSAIMGVRLRLEDGGKADAEFFHGEWMRARLADGWTLGDTVDHQAKTHPCLRPYGELPEAQRRKDLIFDAAVRLGALIFQPAQSPV